MKIINARDNLRDMKSKLEHHLFDEQSIEKSCFLAEESQCGFKGMNPLMARDNTIYVAIDDVLQDDIMGCVAVEKSRFFCPFPNPASNRYKLHTLCVNSNTRGKGVGTQLVGHVLNSLPHASTVYLTVCCPTPKNTKNKYATAILHMRYDKLVRLYEVMGFKQIQCYNGYLWMQHHI